MSGIRRDYENQLCAEQAFTGASTVSASSYAKQSAAQDLSIGCRMALVACPTVDAGAGSTHTMQVIQADDAALTSNITVLGEVIVLAADLVKGKEIEIPIPQGVMDQLYIGFRHSASGGATTVTLDVYFGAQEENVKYKSFPKINDADV